MQQDNDKDGVQSKTTREYDVMKRKYADIIEKLAAKGAAEVLSRKLFEAGMITKDMEESANLPTVIQTARIRPVVSAVLDMVKTDEESYRKFIAILRKTEGLSEIAVFIEEYSVCEDLHLPECVSEEQIENYLPKCELKMKVFVECHSKERKLVIHSGSEKECSEAKEYIKQKIFPLVLQFHPVKTRHIQTTHTSFKLNKTQHYPRRGLACFTLEDQPNLGVHSTAEGGTLIAGVNADVYKSIREKMTEQLKQLCPYQRSLKVGYEARFGRVHWRFPQGQTSAKLCTLEQAENAFFETRITGDIREQVESRTSRISEVEPVKLLDPLRVVVTIGKREQEVVAVVDEGKDGRFTLNRVYYTQAAQPQGKLTCDIVFPNKAYDIRIAPNYAPVLEEGIDDEIKETIQEVVGSIKITRQREIKMPVRGKNYRVKYMRRKTQTQHQWKKRKEWILAEYDVEEFEGEKNGEIAFKRKKKEIELWSQKWFPDSSNESRLTRSHCAQLKSTASLSLPYDDEIEASSWTAESLMESFEDFVSVAVDIVDILSG